VPFILLVIGYIINKESNKRAEALQTQLITIQQKQSDSLSFQVQNQEMQLFTVAYPACFSKTPNPQELFYATLILSTLEHLPRGPKDAQRTCVENATNNTDLNVRANADIGVANSTPAAILQKPNAAVSLSKEATQRILDQRWVVVVANVGTQEEARDFIRSAPGQISSASGAIAQTLAGKKLCFFAD
jgi:hypothetical protein